MTAKISTMTEGELITSIINNSERADTSYAFLLGAGASESSDIPVGSELASKWLKEIERDNQQVFNELQNRYKHIREQPAKYYPQIYSARFKSNPRDGYSAIEQAMENAEPAFGYTVLAQILSKTKHNLVLTTNFDRLLESALLYYTNTHARVINHHNMISQVFVNHHHGVNLVKVHGDMYASPLSEQKEIDKLHKNWQPLINEIARQYHIVAIGYGGNDGGLMTMLKSALRDNTNARLIWCSRGESAPAILDGFDDSTRQRVCSVQIGSFDDLMLKLNSRLKYGLLDKGGFFDKQAEKRKERYSKQLAKLVDNKKSKSTTAGNAALEELLADSWWEVELEVRKHKNDPDKQDQLYQQGMAKFPDSHQLLCNYANFLTDIRKEHDKAEEHYVRALQAEPDDANINGNYARFLHTIRKEHDKAEEHYVRALQVEPDKANINGNYANFLKNIRKEYDKAEEHYVRALQAEPDDAYNNGNYAGFLLARGKKSAAGAYLKKAEKNTEEELLLLELAFYRLAHYPECAEQSRQKIRQLLAKGARSPGWDFSGNIAQAKKDGCTNIDELRELAAQISSNIDKNP